ncbi:MAG: hypothetical protein ACM3O6_07630 [Acidobacteriota bacterium]
MRRYFRATLLAGMLGAALTHQVEAAGIGASSLPPGLYDCTLLSTGGMVMLFGTIEIKGLTFRTATDGNYGPWKPYQIDNQGVITWGGPFGDVETEGTRVVASIYKSTSPPTFDVTLKTVRDTFPQLNCSRRP